MIKKYAGGNFWDGMREGLIVAGLNHCLSEALEKGEENSKAKAALDKLHIKYDDKPEFSKTPALDLVNRDPNLNQMSKNGNNPSLDIDAKLADKGKTDPISGNIKLGKAAFTSYKQLYLTLGHELIHSYHVATGLITSWTKEFGPGGARYISERAAYSWVQSYDEPSMRNYHENQFQNAYWSLNPYRK